MSTQRAAAAVILVLFGAFAFTNSLNNQRLTGMRGSDQLQLIESGLCVGLAIGVLLVLRKFPGE
jgi:hypothetical protein